MNALICYIVVINLVSFMMFGIDKTLHSKFRYGVPIMLLVHIALMAYFCGH